MATVENQRGNGPVPQKPKGREGGPDRLVVVATIAAAASAVAAMVVAATAVAPFFG